MHMLHRLKVCSTQTCRSLFHSWISGFWTEFLTRHPLVFLQIPHGKKYDKKWLLTALQNLCSVPFTPIQVSWSQPEEGLLGAHCALLHTVLWHFTDSSVPALSISLLCNVVSHRGKQGAVFHQWCFHRQRSEQSVAQDHGPRRLQGTVGCWKPLTWLTRSTVCENEMGTRVHLREYKLWWHWIWGGLCGRRWCRSMRNIEKFPHY